MMLNLVPPSARQEEAEKVSGGARPASFERTGLACRCTSQATPEQLKSCDLPKTCSSNQHQARAPALVLRAGRVVARDLVAPPPARQPTLPCGAGHLGA
eukprot:CAMPEP_0204209318 /NCGR_PEP_ID=MMETSP0361-20130328/73126_1 /ASSEMBLY_ACC=CAM_ASM_000343 /TAXON_ID=268821 /ORGANISM="Scrippsiella Hangoei, Strain SHTV-5" /LENGTH=98 /DNA_ID=CAMNT_0051173259 /DNA_START=608 /DNA_END=901 /DNA_ORIENTATION=+